MTNDVGDVYSDGLLTDELFSLNRFLWGSSDPNPMTEPPSERPLKNASNDLQRSALFLSNHADVLHGLVQFARLDELFGDGFPPEPTQVNIAKRRRRIRPHRAVKRTSRRDQ